MTSQDFADQLEQPGPIYVYEKGKLIVKGRRCRSLGENPFPKAARLEAPHIHVPNYHQVQLEHGQFNVASLRSICIEFVAKHITIVESLVGFPDQVGSEIYKSVSKQGHLENYKSRNVKTILQLFTDSYQDAVMSDLDLSVFPRLMLEDSLDVTSTFIYLNKLDVNDQQLGDDHALWKSVAEMEKLTHLAVKNNLLSNDGLQKMTLPCRMFKRGPIHLEVLNLACNPAITDAGVHYLLCFHLIHDLDLSGTGVKNCGLQKLEHCCSLTQLPMADKKKRMFSLKENCGWAADIIKRWLTTFKESTVKDERLKNTSPLMSTSSFYNRRSSHQYLARTIKEQFPRTPCPSPEPQIHLVKKTTLSSTSVNSEATIPKLSMNVHNNQSFGSSVVMNLCTTDAKRKQKESLSNNTLMSRYSTSSLHSENDLQSQSSTSNMSAHGKNLMETTKKTNKFSVSADLKVSSKCLDSNSELLSEYGSKIETSTEKSLWSAMNSNQW